MRNTIFPNIPCSWMWPCEQILLHEMYSVKLSFWVMLLRGKNMFSFSFPSFCWLQGRISSHPDLYASVLCCFGHVWLFATPRTVVRLTPLSMGFPRQEYWSGLPFPPSGDFPDPGIKPKSPALRAHSLLSESPGKLWFIILLTQIIH